MNEVARIGQPSPPSETLCNIEAEQQLLGAILLQNEVYEQVSSLILSEAFFDPVHQRIFDRCAMRITSAHLASPVTLKTDMADDDGLKALGGAGYLVRIAGVADLGNAQHYARLISELHCRRRLTEALQEAHQGLSAGGGSGEVAARLYGALQALPEAAGEEATVSMLRAMTEAVQVAGETYQGARSYLRTGIEALDDVLKGLGPGNVMLIGAATGMGKTSVALDIAANVAARGIGVAFVSLEMTRQELASRLASRSSRIPYTDVRDAESMSEADFRKWVEATPAVGNLPIRIIPKHVRDIAAIHAAVKRTKRELGDVPLGLVVIDYAQLVRGPGKDTYQQQTQVSIGIKALAGVLEVPVIALVQLNREIAGRDFKRPRLTDIKETGQYENDADQVVLCHREAYWLQKLGPKPDKNGQVSLQSQADWEVDMAKHRNVMDLIVAKNRHGREATCQIGFHAPTGRFWRLGQE